MKPPLNIVWTIPGSDTGQDPSGCGRVLPALPCKLLDPGQCGQHRLKHRVGTIQDDWSRLVGGARLSVRPHNLHDPSNSIRGPDLS